MIAPPMPCLCEVCNYDVLPHHWSVAIGEGRAHAECAADSREVCKCCLCGQLAMVDNIGNWPKHPEGRMCEDCAAETDPIEALDAMIDEVRRG